MDTQNTQGFGERPDFIWQLQEAKAMLSAVIKKTQKRPQIITVSGKNTAVILSFEQYRKLTCSGQNLFQFIQNSPLRDIELELPRRLPEGMRGVDL
jgi:prevent-host-death family protein